MLLWVGQINLQISKVRSLGSKALEHAIQIVERLSGLGLDIPRTNKCALRIVGELS
ncbi:hypothetical protein D3C73_1632630 [compost metagenome]